MLQQQQLHKFNSLSTTTMSHYNCVVLIYKYIYISSSIRSNFNTYKYTFFILSGDEMISISKS